MHKNVSNLSNYILKRLKKARKIKKRPKKILKARTKAEYEKFQILTIFFWFLELTERKNSCVPIF